MTEHTQAQESEREEAPPNSLPDWSECAMRVENSKHFAKQVAEGGYGPEPDSKLATELHRFIYEYDDASAYGSAWFLHRLELLLNETRAAALASPQASTAAQAPSDAVRQIKQSIGESIWMDASEDEFARCESEKRILFASPQAASPEPHPPWCSGGCCNPDPSSAASELVSNYRKAVVEWWQTRTDEDHARMISDQQALIAALASLPASVNDEQSLDAWSMDAHGFPNQVWFSRKEVLSILAASTPPAPGEGA